MKATGLCCIVADDCSIHSVFCVAVTEERLTELHNQVKSLEAQHVRTGIIYMSEGCLSVCLLVHLFTCLSVRLMRMGP